MAIRYVRFWAETDYAGTDFEDYQAINEKMTEEDLNEIAEQFGQENAESYEYLATGWEGEFESEEDREQYYENCTCGWDYVSREEWEENEGGTDLL